MNGRDHLGIPASAIRTRQIRWIQPHLRISPTSSSSESPGARGLSARGIGLWRTKRRVSLGMGWRRPEKSACRPRHRVRGEGNGQGGVKNRRNFADKGFRSVKRIAPWSCQGTWHRPGGREDRRLLTQRSGISSGRSLTAAGECCRRTNNDFT
jgi:hypothetical protein